MWFCLSVCSAMSADLLGLLEPLPHDKQQYEQALKVGVAGFLDALEIFQDPGFDGRVGWKLEAEGDGDRIHSKQTRHGRLFCAKFVVEVDLDTLMQDNWHNAEQMSEWNSHVEFCKVLVVLTANSNIVHYGNCPTLMVSGRDFVSLRIRRELNGVVYTSGRSVEAPGIPDAGGRVRAVINLGGGRFQRCADNPDHTQVELMHCIDFKGRVPHALIHSVMGKMMLKDCQDYKDRAVYLRTNKKTLY